VCSSDLRYSKFYKITLEVIMLYAEMYEKSKKAGSAVKVVPEFVQWETAGVILIGELLGVEKIKSAKGKGDYFKYSMQTDDGVKCFSLGASMDKVLSDKNYVGKVLYIEFLGKKDLPKGKRMNLFDVRVIGEAEKPTKRNNVKAVETAKKPGLFAKDEKVK
jgi:hypothetical protein